VRFSRKVPIYAAIESGGLMGTFAPEQYKETLIFLATAGVVVPLFRRLKFSPVLGFLGAGVLLGPYGLGALARQIGWLAPFALDNVEQIAPVAEFGIVFLLFHDRP
jgi:monovalent cation:H+ antiporter-2, CPA2 family